MVWRFHPSSNPLDVRSAAVVPQSFSGFDANECYVLLHIYRRKEAPQGGGAPRAAPPPPAAAVSPALAAGRGASSTADLASSTGQLFTPRGLSGPFSGYDDSGPYPFERRDVVSGEPPLAHDIYIWNGKAALPLVKAVALTKCFELERYLINDDVGAIHYIHRGCCGPGGGELLPADSMFRADYRPPKLPEAREENHLLALLCGNADGQPIECSSLLACMLPQISAGSVQHAQFPELHRALFAPADTASAAPAAPAAPAAQQQPTGAPAHMVKLNLSGGGGAPPPPPPPPGEPMDTGAAPVPQTARPAMGIPKLGLGGGGGGGSERPARPASAAPGGRPASAAPGGVPKIGGLGGLGGAGAAAGGGDVAEGGGMSKVPKLSKAQSSGIGLDLKRVHEMEDQGAIPTNERDQKAERLRIFSVICSEITPQVSTPSPTHSSPSSPSPSSPSPLHVLSPPSLLHPPPPSLPPPPTPPASLPSPHPVTPPSLLTLSHRHRSSSAATSSRATSSSCRTTASLTSSTQPASRAPTTTRHPSRSST